MKQIRKIRIIDLWW